MGRASSITTDTYYNIFPISKYLKLTNFDEFKIEISLKGKCLFELIEIYNGDYYRYEKIAGSQLLVSDGVEKKRI